MHDDLDLAFNTLWADNGDAISREVRLTSRCGSLTPVEVRAPKLTFLPLLQYAGSSALKGDFTRSGVSNWKGAVNDASNSMARLMQGAVTGASSSPSSSSSSS